MCPLNNCVIPYDFVCHGRRGGLLLGVPPDTIQTEL